MTSYKDLNQFITAKCRDEEIRIETLPKLCGISRSTLYRIMKGKTPVNAETEQKLCSVLHLSEEEEGEFHRLAELSSFDQSLVRSRQVLDRMVFGSAEVEETRPIQLIYFDEEQYYRTLDELLEAIVGRIGPKTRCSVQILNCMSMDILRPFSAFIRKLRERAECSRVQQMLSFDSKDYLANTQAFISIAEILSLNTYQNYTAYVGHRDDNTGGLFSDTILIELSGEQPGSSACYWFSFFEDGISNCAKITDPYQCAFVRENFSRLKLNYDDVLCDSKGINTLGREMVELCQGSEIVLIKPNICYDMVPMEQYESLARRCEAMGRSGELNSLLSLKQPSGEDCPEDGIRQQMLFLSRRAENSRRHCYWNLMSKPGIVELARTGRLTDHLEMLPAFDKRETRGILEYIRDRSLDPKDPYQLFITERPILENGLIIVVCRGKGIIVEYNQEGYRSGEVNNIHYHSPQMEEVFFDYLRNHIPKEHAVSNREAAEFINLVLEKYL